MVEPTTAAIDGDELRLAQLACTKLAGLLQGTISIGLPALVSGVPDPRSFLAEQLQVMNAFALVLHTASGKPAGQQEVLRLRERSRNVLMALEDLQRRLLEPLDSSNGPALTFQSARDSALRLCDAIGDYALLVKLDRSRITKVKGVVLQVFDGIETMNTVGEPSAG